MRIFGSWIGFADAALSRALAMEALHNQLLELNDKVLGAVVDTLQIYACLELDPASSRSTPGVLAHPSRTAVSCATVARVCHGHTAAAAERAGKSQQMGVDDNGHKLEQSTSIQTQLRVYEKLRKIEKDKKAAEREPLRAGAAPRRSLPRKGRRGVSVYVRCRDSRRCPTFC